jgi:O-antigen/teichoic acid export membrane protein
VLDTPEDATATTGANRTPGDAERRATDGRGIVTDGLTLRAHAARGVLINGVFDLGISSLSLVEAFIVAALLTRSQYGVWGVLVVSLGVLAQLKVVGISDKYLQQQEPDQELAFQRAFTLDVLMTAAAMIPLTAALPLIAVVYNHWDLVAPGAVLLTVVVADALQAPFWVYYRQMNFARQRRLGVVEPLVGFVVTVALAIAGLGYWSLVIGVAVGAWAGAATALRTSQFRIRWRYDRSSLHVYVRFSGPILIATICSVVLANGAVIASNAHLGLAGVGAVALAANITAFTTRVDDLVSGTLYPAICAIQDRVDLLRETFVKTNRLALMWAMPLGIGLALFGGDLVHFVLGNKWHAAIPLLRITGVVAAISHIGFNWDDYFRARGQTAPIAVAAVASTVVLLGAGIPLLFSDGLTGLGIGIGAGALVHLIVRIWYISRLFLGFRILPHAMRAVLPTVPAAAVVLVMRALEAGTRGAGIVVLELAVYVVVTGAGTWIVEHQLLREAVGYMLRRAR